MPQDQSTTLRDVAEVAGLITASATGLTTLAFYFGWRRTETYAEYFGVENSVLGFSVQDYVLRSSAPVYHMIQLIVALCLGLIVLHRFAWRRRRLPAGRYIGGGVAVLGAFLCLVWWGAPVNELLGGVSPAAQAAWAAAVGAVLAGLAFRPGGPRGGGRSAAPLLACALVLADAAAAPTAAYVLRAPFVARDTALAFGLAFLLYAVSYLRPARRSTAEPAWLRSLLVVFVGLFGAAGLFAATDEYARAVGVDEAELTAARLDERRGVVVFSEHDLGLAPVGRCKPVRGRNQAFRLRCDGLRLFVQTPRGLLVISSTWSRADGIGRNDRMIVIPVDDSVRVEFTPGESELPYPEQ